MQADLLARLRAERSEARWPISTRRARRLRRAVVIGSASSELRGRSLVLLLSACQREASSRASSSAWRASAAWRCLSSCSARCARRTDSAVSSAVGTRTASAARSRADALLGVCRPRRLPLGCHAERFCRLGRRFRQAGVALVVGALVGRFGEVVVVGDRSVGVFSARLSVVGGEPLLGRDGRRLSGAGRPGER